MYVPEPFTLTDRGRIGEIVRRYNFGILVTAPSGAPHATHLPFLFAGSRGANGTLLGHMARANPQWRDFAGMHEGGQEALVIFQGPHAYISPSWYAAGPAVPTWNYLSVHAYGTPRIIDDAERVRALLGRLVATHEAGSTSPWRMESLDDAYLAKMQRGIVAFEITLTRVQAKAKLNQNRAVEDRRGAILGLEATGEVPDCEVAAAMRELALPD